MGYRVVSAFSVLLAVSGCARLRAMSDDASGSTEDTAPVVKPAPPATSTLLTKPAAPPQAAEPEAKPEPASRTNGAIPRGFVRVSVGGVAPTAQGNAVLLVDESRARAVPIFVGDSEALSIQLRLEKRRYARPLTHDLLDAMLSELGGRIDSVRVEKLEDDVFFGIVVLREGARRVEIDARTSDAVALAIGSDAPIFVNEHVIQRAGVKLDDIEKQTPAERASPEPGSRRPDPISL